MPIFYILLSSFAMKMELSPLSNRATVSQLFFVIASFGASSKAFELPCSVETSRRPIGAMSGKSSLGEPVLPGGLWEPILRSAE